jgi:hypothetical protein
MSLGSSSKKGYRGTLAGLGRVKSPTAATGPVFRSGPRGPAGARFGSVQLPKRSNSAPSGGPKPSLMTRIAGRMAGVKRAFGF